ncbi:MAG: phage tail tip lysozyme, partial [Gaiellaceae bacterium]
MLQGGGAAFAQNISTQDIKDINNATPWYDPNFGGCTTGAGVDVNLVGNDNIEKAYNFLVSQGLQNFQAAGIVGNLMQESGVNPKSNQGGGPGKGIAQWSEGGRWNVLVGWVAVGDHFPDGKPRDPLSLEGQLAFMLHEMKDVAPWNETMPALKGTTTVEQATQVFEDKFEKAGTPNMPNRIKYARQVLDKYGGGGGQTNPTTGEAVSDCPSNSGG